MKYTGYLSGTAIIHKCHLNVNANPRLGKTVI